MPKTTVNFDTARKIGVMLPGVRESTVYGAPALGGSKAIDFVDFAQLPILFRFGDDNEWPHGRP